MLGTDIICQAKSGMGKTAVFVLTTLHLLKPVAGEIHVVVLCHTRELAFQIQKEYERFSKYLPDIKSRVFYGGETLCVYGASAVVLQCRAWSLRGCRMLA